jgi:hypothetical protein
MLRGGEVLAIDNCRCPGFQIHDRNFESESFKASQEGYPQENDRNESCYGTRISSDDVGRVITT